MSFKTVVFTVLLWAFGACKAQKAAVFTQEFKKAKQLVDAGAFTEALPLLLKLTVENPQNTYFKDASYLYAYASLKTDSPTDALQMLKQIELKYSDYNPDQIYYMQALCLFYLKEYDKALITANKSKHSSVTAMKLNFINNFKDVSKLTDLYNRNSNDTDVAKVLMYKLSVKDDLTDKESKLLADLSKKLTVSPKTENSNNKIFNIGVLLPYSDLNDNFSKNSLFFDFHCGLNQGLESMVQTDGFLYQLHYFDIGKDTTKYLELINSKEYQNLDMVIGPVYSNLSSIAAQHSSNKSPLVINPFSQNIKQASNTLYTSPSYQNIGVRTAEFCKSELGKNVIVCYSSNIKDSVSAFAFVNKFKSLGGKIIALKNTKSVNFATLVNKETADSVSAVVMYTSNAYAATSILTALEVANCKAPVIVPKDWLDINTLTLQKYARHNVHFCVINYYSLQNQDIIQFNNTYYGKYKLYPTEYSYLGYDIAKYFGNAFTKYNKNMYSNIQNVTETQIGLLQGFNFYKNNSNQVVQFVKFTNGKLEPLIEYTK
ncbi:MAG: ABC transporter substrate-binding protein [Cytophagales bacterium]